MQKSSKGKVWVSLPAAVDLYLALLSDSLVNGVKEHEVSCKILDRLPVAVQYLGAALPVIHPPDFVDLHGLSPLLVHAHPLCRDLHFWLLVNEERHFVI